MKKPGIQGKRPFISDLREWLLAADALGELQAVPEADWNLEIGGISQINYRRRPNKAQLFDEIKGYPKGYRILTASMGSTRRMAMTFRLAENLGERELVEELRGKPCNGRPMPSSSPRAACNPARFSKRFTGAPMLMS